ncbi:DUF2075 domain-containing protein [Paraburkholderia nemoris]|uniref:DNA/RNA helicase domain-containing protein n=1 Tax=Paraburkholderia nemoris TaxID=2793076 RepID=UPI0038BD6605
MRVTQTSSRSTRRVDWLARPYLCSMPQSSLQFVTYAIADAMLAGPPEAAAMVERMTLVLGERADWMNGLARGIAKRFGARWDSVDSKELSKVVAENTGFVSAWRGESRPRVVRVLPRPPVQRPPPPWLHGVALPQLPTLGDLAAWLEVEPDELDWFADRWRVSAQSAVTPLHHYSYKAIEKRDGRCRIIEVPKMRLRALQRKVLHGLLDRVTYTNGYVDAQADSVDVLVTDEAHRIRDVSSNRFTPANKKSGLKQLEELIAAARVSVFFIDDHQVVRPAEIGSVAYIREYAEKHKCAVYESELETQFRCNGSDAFVRWINTMLPSLRFFS